MRHFVIDNHHFSPHANLGGARSLMSPSQAAARAAIKRVASAAPAGVGS
jgi:hypothetical protein